MNLETLLVWSAPKQITKRDGSLVTLRTATPSACFWNLWRSNKSELQAAGIAPSKDDNGNWSINWWQRPGAPAAIAPLSDRAAAAPVVTTAASLVGAPVLAGPRIWSLEQQAIFQWSREGKGNAAVVARAGTGKTATAEEAIKVSPDGNILYAVFNKKNQKEAEAKIRDERVTISTWHALGFQILKGAWGSNIKPEDEVENERVDAAIGMAVDGVFAAVKKLVGIAKNVCPGMPSEDDLVRLCEEWDIVVEMGEEEDERSEENPEWPAAKLAKCAGAVLTASMTKDKQGRISFNDMLWLPVVLRLVHPCFDLVIVDECQDTNAVQLEMACRIVTPEGRTLVIGDDRQAIYHFRGAHADGLNFMIERLRAQRLTLTTTYRCAKAIVELAAKIVPDYHAHEANGEGFVDTVTSARIFESVKPGDAVLSRSNAPLMPICLNLLRNGVPARIEGKDVGTQLKGIVRKLKAKSMPDFFIRLSRWQQRQLKRAEKTLKKDKCAAKCAEINDQADTLRAIAETVNAVHMIEQKISSLFTDSATDFRPAVVCSTVHKAKGLEWNHTFILSATFRTPEATEGEEANIYYVALTRAKKHLTFVI